MRPLVPALALAMKKVTNHCQWKMGNSITGKSHMAFRLVFAGTQDMNWAVRSHVPSAECSQRIAILRCF